MVLGNEVRGCSEDVLGAVDGVLEIPQFGVKHSLNVSVAAGMVCWQAFRSVGARRRLNPPKTGLAAWLIRRC